MSTKLQKKRKFKSTNIGSNGNPVAIQKAWHCKDGNCPKEPVTPLEKARRLITLGNCIINDLESIRDLKISPSVNGNICIDNLNSRIDENAEEIERIAGEFIGHSIY